MARVVTVENSTEHLSDSDLSKIFERFYRIDKSRNKPGTGLGLSLVAAVVALHGGTVEAQNTAGGLRIITKF